MTITWIKCSDQLPDDEILVLVATQDGKVFQAFHEYGEWWEYGVEATALAVTHWAHLPPHPDDACNNEEQT